MVNKISHSGFFLFVRSSNYFEYKKMFKCIKGLLSYGVRVLRRLGYGFTFLWIFIDYNLIHETLKFLCAILTAKNQFRFSFDEKSLYEFYCVDIVCKKIKQCNERLTAGINLEWQVYFHSFTHLGNNTSSGFLNSCYNRKY